uniref:DUF4328 domain-containing protein n=1 Tax=Streptomyces sp. NBC_00003 TaxID=2903608 RepID=A0AAU2UYS2_9ACTN
MPLRSPRGLATATSVLLAVAAAVDAFAVYAGAVMHGVSGDLLSRGEDEIDRADHLYQAAGLLQVLALVVTAVVFIVWFHRVRCNADVFAGDVCTRGKGWAIGGWFIPVGNLWIPSRIAREIWTASAQSAPDGSWRTVSQRPITAWWSLWVANLVIGRIASTMDKNADTPEALQRAADVTMLADALSMGAAILAIVFVRKLTAMQDLKATQGPVAAL